MTPIGNQDTRPRLREAAGIGLVAIALRIAFIVGFGLHDIRYDSLYDDQLYTNLAHQVVQGHGYATSVDYFVASAGKPTSVSMPGYPLLLAASFSIFGPSYLPVKLLQAVLGGLTAAALYGLTSLISGRRAGALAGLIAAGYLPFIMYVRPLLTETVSSFLSVTAVFAVYALVTRPSMRLALASGLLLGLGVMTRAEMLAYAAVLVAFVAYQLRRRCGMARVVRYCGLITLGIVVFLIPWTARNWRVHQRFLISDNKIWTGWATNWLRYQQEHVPEWREIEFPERRVLPNWQSLSEVDKDWALFQLNATFVQQHPIVFTRYAVSRLLHSFPVLPRELLPAPWGTRDVPFIRTDGLGQTALDEFPRYKTLAGRTRVWSFRAVFVLAVAGALLAFRRQQLSALAPLLAFIAINAAVAAALAGKERYRLTIDPYLILFATIALTSMLGRGPRHLSGSSEPNDVATHNGPQSSEQPVV